MGKFFVTTPIYYVNDVPHIGSAYTTVAADVLARAHRQFGDEVLFLTGTDEHGAKIAQKAADAGQEPQEYVDTIAKVFQDTWGEMAMSYDRFARTTDETHMSIVRTVFQRLYDTEYLYPAGYEGWYCVGCEEYKDVPPGTEHPTCDIHQKPLELVKETVYYFALSKFQDKLITLIEKGTLKINPVERRNEVLSFLKGEPLRDIPFTRSKVAWGVEVPFAPEQTIYVWVDALLFYLTFSKVWTKTELSSWDTIHQSLLTGPWPATLQLIGKDILRFHAVIWPATLLALELPTQKELFVHGFFTVNSQKMSKSLGNVIRPAELTERYGVDAARFLILSAVPYGSDGDISIEKMDAVYTAQLANGLGNLVQRTIVLINKFGIKPQVKSAQISQIKEAFYNNDITEAITQITILVDDANRYLATEQPWAMENDAERENVLVKTYEELLKITEAIRPIMPGTAESMATQLETLKPEPLFPRLS